MNAKELRAQFLETVPKIIERATTAFGEGTPSAMLDKREETLMKYLWPTVHTLITESDDAANIKGLSEGPISDRVDNVLEQVAKGTLSIPQGKRLIEMLQAGFNITELPRLVAKLNGMQHEH
jgi:hypothetical protein